MNKDRETTVELGRLGRPHGLRGEIKLHLHNPQSRFFESGRRVIFIGADGTPRELTVAGVRGGQPLILRFAGIDTVEQAAALGNGRVLARAADLPALPKGEYYHHQLLGLTAVDESGAERGRVVAVESGPAHDQLKLAGPGGAELLIPLVKEFIAAVDLPAQKIHINFGPLDHAL